MFEQLTILAPGLLGASLGMAAKQEGLVDRVVVWARRAEARLACAKEPWCDETYDDPAEASESADLVVLCPPVEAIEPLTRRIAPALAEGALVTDVGSTKSLICRHCSALMPEGRHFLGSHPMAGSEKSGMDYADASLFRNRPCFVTPLADTPDPTVDQLARFWDALGMEVITASPEKHDEIVANISHLPHMLATLLCTQLSQQEDCWRNFSGNGLRDTTRVAAGSPEMWRAIVKQNRDEILRALEGFQTELQGFQTALYNGDYLEVANYLERGKVWRDRLRPGD